MNILKSVAFCGSLVTACLSFGTAHAVPIGNVQGTVEFPAGEVSFADVIVDYSPVINSGQPTEPYRGAVNALGVPDYTGSNGCADQASCTFVSLGDGGSIVFRFTDNILTGSDDNSADLHIFEIGPDVENTFVDISVDGSTWLSVGSVGGSVSSIDIDSFGYGTSDQFAYVRLTDDPNEGGQSGDTVGADIDAIGAISTVRIVTTPEPGIAGLFGVGLAGLGAAAWRRRKNRS
jgi:hypothetical protein